MIYVTYPDPLDRRPPRKPFWTPERDAELRKWLGVDYELIAISMGTTGWMVRSRLIKLGLRRPARNRR